MSTADASDLETTSSPAFAYTHASYGYAVTHVFFPVELPRKTDYTLEDDLSLARAVCTAAHAYTSSARVEGVLQWHRITKMLNNLQVLTTSEQLNTVNRRHVISQLCEMQTGDTLVFFIRRQRPTFFVERQDAALILTRRENYTLFELFGVPPSSRAGVQTADSLKCSYPWSAVETSNQVFDDEGFQSELVDLLFRPNHVKSDYDFPSPADPQYNATLLTDIMRSVGRMVDVLRITKHVRDDFVQEEDEDEEADASSRVVWRRSSLWLLIRVAVQMAIDRTPLGRASYKRFMLFFICTLARDPSNTNLSSDLLHLMSSKIFRRLSKLGSSTPNWLSELALNTCACLRDTLDARWKPLSARSSLFRNPSQDELKKDTVLSLLDSRGYICNAFGDCSQEPHRTPFHPSHRRRGTIDDFLSSHGSFFDEGYDVDPDVTLHDVEQSVEQGIDDWISRVTNVEEACAQLEILMDKYMIHASLQNNGDPEHYSVMLLTGLEFFVALDKLVVREIPMLVDYSPDLPIAFLERLLLRKTTSLHRLARAYQYILARHSRSRPGWSVLSNKFTEDSFAVRYYDQSTHLQQLKARIEEDAMPTTRDDAQLPPTASVAGVCDGYQESHQHLAERRLAQEGDNVPKSSLPPLPLHAKVVVFELHCPVCVRIWRSAAPRMHFFYGSSFSYGNMERDLLARVPGLQRYFVHREGPPLRVQIHFAYWYLVDSQSQKSQPTSQYVLEHRGNFSLWWPKERYTFRDLSSKLTYDLGYGDNFLRNYVNSTFHTSNEVISNQARCPADLSLDEFIAFGHLRSGGSLQWLNILRGLHSKTLNLRRHDVHHLLAHAVSQAGPLDPNTGSWIWHKELQDSSFCDALLDELCSSCVEVGAGSIDGVLMSTITLLLTRVLASGTSEHISDRAIALLWSVRRKTFNWVQELSYNLAMAPMNEERGNLVWNMAAICRSTFNIDSVILHKVFRSAEDVDALLSCALLIYALRPTSKFIDDKYSRLLLQRDSCLTFTVEETLSGVILADASDYGVDLAVAKILASHKPGALRWKRLQHPNSRWLTCETVAAKEQPSQTVHVNLLNGQLRVDGQPLGGLPRAIRDSSEWKRIFCDQGLFLIPSNLPGMDFTTLTTMADHKIHFSLRDDNLVVRVQSDQTNDILELVPLKKLRKDLPPALVDGHVHWLNLSTKVVEIRPFERLWEESSENWRIDCTAGQYRMYKGCETLVDIRSPTWAMVSKCFVCLHSADNLLITCSIDSRQSPSVLRLSVVLPYYGLSFFVNEREKLESRDFKNMFYDENQCVGGLFGLEDLLVLRQDTHLPEGLVPRRILIPSGRPIGHGNHRVRVHGGARPGEPLYHTYDVDTELGCLIGNGSLASMRCLADLHAATSWHRPDPLTGKTGARAALSLLQSAGCRSVMKLKALSGDDHWTSTRYPQINAANKEIQHRYYWNYSADERAVIVNVPETRAARRAAYLFLWHAPGKSPAEDGDCDDGDHSTMHVHTGPGLIPSHPISPPQHISNHGAPWQITLDQLLFDRLPPELPLRSTLPCDRHKGNKTLLTLDRLFSSLPTYHRDSFQQKYITDLEASAQCLRQESPKIYKVAGSDRIKVLERHYAQCRMNYYHALDTLKKSLGPTSDLHEQAIERFGQWPAITADNLLRYLASTSLIEVPLCWKKCFMSLALLLSELQRARRLLQFALDGLEEEFSSELENEGYDGWNPEEYPDWLLIQIQGNFLIRRAQAETAMEMMSPKSGENTVMQVNMGEGKSSVITPIAAAALADGSQLVRVIVPRALTVQMFELLVARLGRLANRPIYHLPFSRFSHDSRRIDEFLNLMSRCMAEHGILLVQPEHVASLKLMSLEKQMHEGKLVTNPLPMPRQLVYRHMMTSLSLKSSPSLVGSIFRSLSRLPNYSGKTDTVWANCYHEPSRDSDGAASKWLSLQKWIHSHVRDILDESDEILHARFQLIYTIGLKQHMDGYPDRWIVTQQVLGLVKKHAESLSRDRPNSIQYESGPPGSFPRVHIVRASRDGGQYLISLITRDIMAGVLPSFDFQYICPALHEAIRSFIAEENVLPDTANRVEEYAEHSQQSHLWSGLLLLRGLLAHNILLFAFAERRWRVDYGLIPLKRNRFPASLTMLAVPYRAKDVPAPNTQFGHPDITIILTCLSYYYTGLSEEQLRVSFESLLDQDDPSTEYALWVKEYDCESLPDSVQQLGEINLKSSEQWDQVIFPQFSRNHAVIDFYLSRVVFPKEAKEFPWKLSASSWDLAEKKKRVITGFSGTNDGRWLLPMSIAQRDLDHQQGTNARVLACLLHPGNESYMVTHENGERWTTLGFLRMVAMQQPEIRVLLDVGAQILDLSNDQVAEAWLDITYDTAGAIYFNENDELVVLTRNGLIQPMRSSPLSQQLDRCVVYLDHAHTRGTDIKLPIGSRAAVTLGPKVTKDHLVQGCMRMRKLGHGHSVMFFAPLEVDRGIRTVVGKKDSNTQVTAVDILCWAIHETWTDVQQRAAYWAQQGMSHKARSDSWSRFCNNEIGPDQLSDAWLQPELKSLADLYAPCKGQRPQSTLSNLDPAIRQRCKDLGVLSLSNAQIEEEQEREVNREQEREREVELPPEAEAAEHFLHRDVVAFVNTGIIPPLHSGSAFRPVFMTLEKSSAATREADVWSPFILATADFCKTIKPESTRGTIDQYLRPVQWILSRKNLQDRDRLLVLLSSFEADCLMPDIRISEHVHLHVYTPRTSQRTKPSDDLKLYSIPPLPSDWTPPWALIDQLNIFAGQLYLENYQSYLRLCHFLGVPTKDLPNDTTVRWNLFNIPGSFEENEIRFSGSPLPSVMALLAMRSRGRPFAQTHMGKILQGQLLSEKDFGGVTSA